MTTRVRILAEPMLAEELVPGDLFSTRGPAYWNLLPSFASCGEAVYIRTAAPAHNFADSAALIFRITILKEEEANAPPVLE